MAIALDSAGVDGRSMVRVRAGTRTRPPRGSTVLLGLLVALAIGLRVGLKDPTAVEVAPAVPRLAIALPTGPRSAPGEGPWFVDRASEFGLDVVTRHGEPDKPSVLHSLGSGVAVFDCDGDGDLDLFVAGGSQVRDRRVVPAGGPWLFRNDGPGRWSDVTSRSGLRHTGWAQGLAVADYDADGDLDLFIAQHGPDALWRNRGDGSFEQAAVAAGLPAEESEWGVGAAWGDCDGDGWPDLYVVNYLSVDAIEPPPLHEHWAGVWVFQPPGMLPGRRDRLWRNRGDGRFEEVTGPSGLDEAEGKGMAAVFADLDGDGTQDLYVTNDTQPNALFRSLGGGRFRDEALEANAALGPHATPEGSMGVEVADVDGDGRLDLIYTNFRHEGTRILLNLDGRTYRDASTTSRVMPASLRFVGWGLAVADLDDDGWPDLFQANGHVFPNTPDADYDQPPLMMRNEGDGRFRDVTSAWGRRLEELRSGRSVAAGDLDGDGDLDLVMTTIDGPLRVLVNEAPRLHHSATVRLHGRHPDLEALGALVRLEAGGRTQVGMVRRGGGFMAASDVSLHFGLGSARRIDRLSVRWPDGSDGLYLDLPADSVLDLRQGEPVAEVRPHRSPGTPSGASARPSESPGHTSAKTEYPSLP